MLESADDFQNTDFLIHASDLLEHKFLGLGQNIGIFKELPDDSNVQQRWKLNGAYSRTAPTLVSLYIYIYVYIYILLYVYLLFIHYMYVLYVYVYIYMYILHICIYVYYMYYNFIVYVLYMYAYICIHI